MSAILSAGLGTIVGSTIFFSMIAWRRWRPEVSTLLRVFINAVFLLAAGMVGYAIFEITRMTCRVAGCGFTESLIAFLFALISIRANYLAQTSGGLRN